MKRQTYDPARYTPQGWKRFVPAPMRSAYRTLRLSIRLMGHLDWSSSAALRDSLRLSRTLLKAIPQSLIDLPWLKTIHRLACELDANGISGDLVECGIFMGGSASILGDAMIRASQPRRLWLFDSFQGLPRPTAADGPGAPELEGDIVGDPQRVRNLLGWVGVPPTQVEIVPGWFNDTFPNAPVGRIALLHIDADWYESIKLCLERFYDQLEPGGVVILDDYYDWPGCKTALDDFCSARGLSLELRGGGDEPAYFRKPA